MAIALSFPLAHPVSVPTSHWDGALAVDLFAPCGTPILAVFDGVATPADWPDGGHTVTLRHADGVQAYYAHLDSHGRASGPVRAGQVIGYVSDSGNARGKGCHLHFAVGAIGADGAGTIPPWEWLAGRAGSALEGAVAGVPVLGPAVAWARRNPWLALGAAAALLLLGRDRRNPEFWSDHHGVHPIRGSEGYDRRVELAADGRLTRAQLRELAADERDRRSAEREGERVARGDVVRPPWAVGLSNRQLVTIAQHFGVSPGREGWWERAGLLKGSGELRETLREGPHLGDRRKGAARGGRSTAAAPVSAALARAFQRGAARARSRPPSAPPPTIRQGLTRLQAAIARGEGDLPF